MHINELYITIHPSRDLVKGLRGKYKKPFIYAISYLPNSVWEVCGIARKPSVMRRSAASRRRPRVWR